MKMRAVASVLVVLCAATARAEQQVVTFTAPDGFRLQGSYHVAEKGGPGILLLHQCSADRQIYNQLATMLNNAGYNVLTFDFRGFGGSKGGEYTDFRAQQQKIIGLMPGDVDAALAYLAAQPTVINRAMGIVAGSCGVNQAIQAARRHPEVRTLVLLSGSSDAASEAFVKSASAVPIFGAASEEDTEAAASIRKIVGLSTHPDSRLEMFKGAGHAASMFAKQPDLEPDIVIWFRVNLPVAGYGLPPAIK